jgi:hypothetical protein
LRIIAVLTPLHRPADRGPWWVGSGTKFDTNATDPMPAGSFVTYYGQQMHFDGAKDEDTALGYNWRRSSDGNARRGEMNPLVIFPRLVGQLRLGVALG